MGLFKCLNFQSFPLYLSKRKASVHFHEQMPCLKAVFLQPLFSCPFSVYSGTFDSFAAFEYNYDRNSKEAAKWVIS